MEHVLRTIHAPFLFGRYRPYENEGRYFCVEKRKDNRIMEDKMILSILVDTFISKISFPMQPGPEIGSISDA